MYGTKTQSYKDMIGTVVSSIDVCAKDLELVFHCTDGRAFRFYHEPDCCDRRVRIEDIVGDLDDLIGSEILEAEETTNQNEIIGHRETWTFYRFSTVKGSVTVRWLGESNGYYSEAVDFEVVTPGWDAPHAKQSGQSWH